MRTILVLIVGVACVAPACAQDKTMKEITEVGGRSLSEWTKDITHKDPSKREVALRAILGFPPEKAYEAMPAILTELRRHSASYPIDLSVRVNIAVALGAILGAKRDADPKVVIEAVTLLKRLLTDGQAIVKLRALQAVAAIGPPHASVVIPDIYPILRDTSNYELRQTGAMAIGQLASDRSLKVSNALHTQLQLLLNDPVSGVRQSACQALATVGSPAEPPGHKLQILKSLETLAKKDPDPGVQIWANYAIMGYNNKVGGPYLDGITHYMSKGDMSTKMQAVQAIGRMGSLAKEALPSVIPGLADGDPNIVAASIWALGRLESERAIPALEKVAADTKQPEGIQKAAKEAVDQIKKAKAAASK